MSILNDIQEALRQSNQARFEKVYSALLHEIVGGNVSLIGSVEGEDKTRAGTPDAFTTVDDGSYIFAAYTTQKGSSAKLSEKLHEDLESSVNEAKSKVSIDEIQKLYLACNSEVDQGTQISLHRRAEELGVGIEIWGINSIALKLHSQFTYLAEDELGVNITSGQILPKNQFVAQYNNGKLATPLDTEFLDCGGEIGEILAALNVSQSVILKGAPGVGKTRIALEAIERFTESSPNTQVHCILNKGAPLTSDLHRYFRRNGQYLILVDDANRLKELEAIASLVRESKPEKSFSFIFTVRSYGLENVIASVGHLVDCQQIKVSPMEREQLANFMEQAFGIKNKDYIDQIWRIADGNARLSAMAAKIAVQRQSLTAIEDATKLYEEYYCEIAQELQSEDGMPLLEVAALTSVFRQLNRSSNDFFDAIERVFGIERDIYWLALRRLDELEIVDLHGEELAKISDQTLATYCFHRGFVREQSLVFQDLLANFQGGHLKQICDALFGAMNSLNANHIREVTDTAITNVIEASDSTQRLKLLEKFWYVNPAKTLLVVKQEVDALPVQSGQHLWEPSGSLKSWSMKLLSNFSQSDPAHVKVAVQLAIEFSAKQPDLSTQVIQLLGDGQGFGLNQFSDRCAYEVQDQAFGIAIEYWRQTKQGWAAELVCALAKAYLNTSLDWSESYNNRVINIFRGSLPFSSALAVFRKEIWNGLNEIWESKQALRDVVQTFKSAFEWPNHGNSGWKRTLTSDVALVIKLAEKFDLTDYSHCAALEQASKAFKYAGDSSFSELLATNNCALFEFRCIANIDYGARGELTYDQMFELQSQQVYDRFGRSSSEEIMDLISGAELLREQDGDSYEIRKAFESLIPRIAATDKDLFLSLAQRYIADEKCTLISPYTWVKELNDFYRKEDLLATIFASKRPDKYLWLFEALLLLEEVSESDKAVFSQCLANCPKNQFPWQLSRSQVWLLAEPTLLKKCLIGLFEREDFPEMKHQVARILEDFRRSELGILSAIGGDFALLEKAYLHADSADENFDYQATIFSDLVRNDAMFVSRYLQFKRKDKKYLSMSDGRRDYAALWSKAYWPNVFEIALVDSAKQERFMLGERDYLCSWFPARGKGDNNRVTRELKKLIAKHSTKPEIIQFIFGLTLGWDSEHRLELFVCLLSLKPSLSLFESISLGSSHMSFGREGCQPHIERHITFLEQLLGFCCGLDLLAHRAYIEEKILYHRHEIERYVKIEFFDD